MRKIIVLAFAVILAATLIPSAYAQVEREVAKGDGFCITEQPGVNGAIIVTGRVIGAFTQKEDFDRVAATIMAKVKELYSARYILRKENQRLYSSGTASQPSGNPLRDTKEYILLARPPTPTGPGPGYAPRNGPNGQYGPRNGNANGRRLPVDRFNNGSRNLPVR